MIDILAEYEYEPTDKGVRCIPCGETYSREGSIMRGHARRCPVKPRWYYIPAVCDS